MAFQERASASIEIAATPEQVWGLVADITRMGSWSPECKRADWIDGSSAPAVGAHFEGHNKAGSFEWSVPCEITECEPGKVFSFAAGIGSPTATRWRFEFEAAGDGTRLTESFDAPMINIEGSPANFEGRYESLVGGIETTIANIKAAAEA
jgi:uncharacterized protein YndB with AHSA1/START domain